MKTPFAPVRSVLAAMARGSLADAPDAELLRRFAADRDEVAFAELVRRYGPLVWRVARTTVGHAQVAEDVFQATFLILAKQAAAVRNPGALAGWLHRTAYRAAVRARRREARPTLPLPPQSAGEDPLDRLTARELLAAVDEEIEALPEALRAAVVLCGVEGLSQEEAAKRLGWSPGSVKGRLERARAKLRRRLEARGLTIPAALVGVGAVPSELVAATLAAVRGEDISPAVAKLVAEITVMNASFWLKSITAVVFTTGALTLLAGYTPAPELRNAAPVLKNGPLVMWSVPLKRACAGAWALDGKRVLTAGSVPATPKDPEVGEVRVWDAASGMVVHTHRGTATAYNRASGGLAVNPAGTLVASGGIVNAQPPWVNEFFVEVWGWGEEKPRMKLGDFDSRVAGLAFSPDGSRLAAVSMYGALIVWDVATGKPVCRVKRRGHTHGLAFHPGGAVLVVVGREGAGPVAVTFYDAATGKDRGEILDWQTTELPLFVAISPDGKTMAAGGVPKGNLIEFDLWDVTVPQAGPVTAENHRVASAAVTEPEGAYQVAFSPDSRYLAVGCSDFMVRVFDVATAKPVAVAKSHTDHVDSVAFSPDGKRLLSVGRDAVKVWSVAELLKRKPK